MSNIHRTVLATLSLALFLTLPEPLLAARAESAGAAPPAAAGPITVCIIPDVGVLYRVDDDEECLEASHERVTLGGAQLQVRDRGTVSISGEEFESRTVSCEAGEKALAGHWSLDAYANLEEFIFIGGKASDDGNGWVLSWVMNGDGTGTPSAELGVSVTCSG